MKIFITGLILFLLCACLPITPETATKTPSKSEIFQITATSRVSWSALANIDNLDLENFTEVNYLDGPDPIDLNAQIASTIQEYQINLGSGGLGWIHPDIELRNIGLQQVMYHSEYPSTIIEDFILSSTITIDSTNPVSACGFAIHSHPNDLNHNQVFFLLTNLPDGYAYFTALAGNKIVNLREFYFQFPTQLTESQIILFSSDNNFQVIVDSQKIGEFNLDEVPSFDKNLPPTPIPVSDNSSNQEKEQFKSLETSYRDTEKLIQLRYNTIRENYLYFGSFEARGYISLASFNETGTTSCIFRNTWLWLSNE